jgi:hypothetical protein
VLPFGLTLPAFCLPALVPACGRLSCRKHAYALRCKSDARTRSCFGLSGAGDGALAVDAVRGPPPRFNDQLLDQ